MFENNITTLGIDIIHLSDLPEKLFQIDSDIDPNRNKWRKDVGKVIQSILRRITNISAVGLELIGLGHNSERNYYEDEGICRFTGQLAIEKSTLLSVKKIVSNICSENLLKNTWFSFNDDTYKWLSKADKLLSFETFHLKSFKFGTLIDLTQFIKHYDSTDRNYFNSKVHIAKDDAIAEFQHYRKCLCLKFRLTSGGKNKKSFLNLRYKLDFDYSSFESIVMSTELDSIRLHINLNHPPILYMVEKDIKPFEAMNKRNKYPKQSSREQYESFVGVHTDEISGNLNWIRENEFYGLSAETIGKSNVVVVELPNIKNEFQSVKYKYQNKIPDPYSAIYMIKRFAQIPVYFAPISEHNCVNSREIDYLLDTNNISLPFPVRYAYLSIFSHTFQASDELFFKFETFSFMESVELFAKINPKATEETLFQISAIIDSRTIFRISIALEKIFYPLKRKNERNTEKVDMKSFNTEIQDIRRCILTPTRLLLLPPQPILKSRFIVNSEPDYTLRLTIREDNLMGLSFTVQRSGSRLNQINFVKKIVKTPLLNGVKIGERVFEFLGSSSSQLRDSGMILYAKDSCGRTAESIRESVGDMSKIRRNVPKYVARLGLVFSQAMTHVNITEETQIDVFPDIEGSFKRDFRSPQLLTKERYVFSDGIGMVSDKIADKVYKQLPNECIHRPSAMQIRFGGCKGMLVVNPKLKGEHIIFRESMKKYESHDRSLGILKLSAPRPVYLNRPLISILEQLKVEPRVFLGMLMDNLKSLANSLVCECSALTLFQNASSLCIPYERLFASGIPFLSEPIFRQIVDCLIPHRIKELKSKARIKVPMNRGRIAFGVLDETGSLEYGQVFAKLSNVSKDGISSNDYFILEGEVMVTKFPCLHPGDVRKLIAVDIPALSHIKDCLVFPSKGPRPHSDEMAGSDLDGDEYALFWNCDLIFDGQNIPAMHFPTGKTQELDHKAEVEDILDFYCDYILSNNVGLLANAHLANADFVDDGIFNEICMSLANKYSVALDFVKTGIVEPIEWKEKPKLYPDFMEKFSEKRTYLSKKVLGQLYRQCCTFEMGIQSKIELEINAQSNPKFALKGWEKYEDWATDAFVLYTEKIQYLLNRFGLPSEAVLLSGAFTKTNRYVTGRTEMNDIHELLESLVGKVFNEFNQKFKTECEFCSPEERSLRASSWYMIAYKLNEDMPQTYFGFPFTITDELCKIVEKSNNQSNGYETHDCVRNSAEVLDQYLEKEGLHRDPVIDRSEGLLETRIKIMESRFKTAEDVIKNWLERQEYLFFRRKNSLKSPKIGGDFNKTNLDIDYKLKRRLIDLRTKIMNEAKDYENLSKGLRTTGNIVMNFMKDLVNEWLSLDSFLQNNSIFDTPLIKFGFSALLALNHFFRTRQISHIIEKKTNFETAIQAPIENDTFYFALPDDQNCRPFVDYIIKNTDLFCKKLQEISGVIEIRLQSYDATSSKLRHCYLLTASGTVWSLQTLKNLISHPAFFNDIPDQNWLEDKDFKSF